MHNHYKIYFAFVRSLREGGVLLLNMLLKSLLEVNLSVFVITFNFLAMKEIDEIIFCLILYLHKYSMATGYQ